MSSEVTAPSPQLCPACNGLMQATETICASCRSQLEAQVFAVRAQDYPVPARPVRKSERVFEHEMVPAAATVDASLGSAVDESADVLPLSPMAAPLQEAPVASAPPAATIARPAPPPTPVEVDTPVEALKTAHTSRNIVIVLVAMVVTAILAAAIWSFVVPTRSAVAEDPTRASR